jgi:DNA polymerase, archaea type
MRMEFWLLDLNYQSRDGKPAICLWGVTEDGRRVLVVQDYQPYFYILTKDSQDPAALKEQLDRDQPHPAITGSILERKKLLGTEKTVIRVACNEADSLEKCAMQTAKALRAESSFEEGIRPAVKYQYDFDVKPCEWYEADLEIIENPEGLEVDAAYHALGSLRATGRMQRPKLGLVAFTMLALSKAGSPMKERDPVQAIAWSSSIGDEPKRLVTGPEGQIITEFCDSISRTGTDFILSFEGNSTEWPYLVRRASLSKTELRIGRDKGPPRQSLFGHFSAMGRANVDLADFAQDLYDVKEKTLAGVLKYLGIETSQSQSIDESEFYRYWSEPDLREELQKMLVADAEDTLTLGKDALDYIIQLSSLSGLPPDQVLAAATGFRVDNHMMMEAHKLGELIPGRNEMPVIPYRGAIVLKPEPGLHDNIAVVDFSSMYPSLMVKYNISPDTFLEKDDGTEAFVVPEVGWRFRKEPAGLFAVVLRNLLDERKRLKREVAKSQKGTSEYRLLKARERAVKILTNATYGYAGWAGARWYSKQVAESAAALGRDTINKSILIAKKLGLKVLYGDTDSLFVNYDKATVDRFVKTVEEELGLEVSLRQVYTRILFTEAMKKYAGMEGDGSLDVVGMEAVRGDWSELAKDVQNQVLRMILEDKGPSRAVSYVARLAEDLKSVGVPFKSFIIWKTLTKRPGDYEVHAPHVEAAKKMVAEGWPLGSGDRVGFVIVNRPGKLFQKSEPYFHASKDELDFDYYVENQILPAAGRALSVFGISEKEILTGKIA